MSLKNLTLFSVRIEAARVCRTPEDYVAITVPLDHELRFYEGTECGGYPPGRAHILWAGKTLDLLIDEPSSLLVVTYPWPWMRDTCESAGTDSEVVDKGLQNTSLSLENPEGRAFWRHLNFVWSESCRGGTFLKSGFATRAIEETSVALFCLALKDIGEEPGEHQPLDAEERRLAVTEAYIRDHLHEPLTFADLVSVSEMSASSLLRAFRAHRGTSPMKFVKQLRLEAAHRALLAADAANESVTAVAFEHCFFQLGRFASDYKKTFGELPSQTLGR